MTRNCSLFLLLSAAILFGCQNKPEENPSLSEYKISFQAKTAGATRTHIESDNDVYGEIWWDESDHLSLFTSGITQGGGLQFTAKSTGAETQIEYVSPSQIEAADEYFGVYPYNQSASFDGSSMISTFVPSEQTARFLTFDPEAAVIAGRSSDIVDNQGTISGQMTFYNVCGGFRFSVSNQTINKVVFSTNGQEHIAGDVQISFNANDPVPSVSPVYNGSYSSQITLTSPQLSLSPDNYYYICMIPQTLAGGFTIQFFNDNDVVAKCEYTQPVEVERGQFWTIDNADNPSLFGKDLSVSGKANCYIVSEAGAYKFPISMGNSDYKPYGEVGSASVVWETLNTLKTPKVGSLIDNISTDGDFVYFTTPDQVPDGNALVAIKNKDGEIMWTWHIWICKGYDPEATAMAPTGKQVKFMDRNLGALDSDPYSQLCNGLFYQWGRKEPFMGVVDRSSSSPEAMAFTAELSLIPTDGEYAPYCYYGSLEYALANPTSFITSRSGSYPNDWLFLERDNSLWRPSKTVYDPCPAGWKVPDGDYSGVWSVSENYKSADEKSKGAYLFSSNGRLFFPAAGYLEYESASISGAGVVGYFWTTTTDSQFANASYVSFAYNRSEFYTYSTGWSRGMGFSVRCVKE